MSLRKQDARRDFAAEEAEVFQAAEGCDSFPEVGQSSGMDDPRRDSGDSARAAPAGAARWRTFCDLGSERSLSSRDQSQQPSEEADGAARAGSHRAQRKAHASGSCRRAVRQRPSRPRAARCQQSPAEVAVAERSKASRDVSVRTCWASASTIQDVR